MKKIISFVTSLSLFFCLLSCDNATHTSDGYIEGIFTVDFNGKGWLLQPELADTSYYVSSIAGFDLQDGDRGVMRLNYKYDYVYGASTATWNVENVIDIIPEHTLTPRADVDTVAYSSAIAGIDYYYAYSPVWLWNKKQNINVMYQGSDASFVMSPIGFEGKRLQLELRANVEEGEKYNTQLLTYDMSNLSSLLGDEDKKLLQSLDTLHTDIYVKYYDYENNFVNEGKINGGSCVNPFKK